MAFQFFNPAKKVSMTHGHLPHWDQEDATYFITWRTADSIPKEVCQRWRSERDAWLAERGIDPTAKDWRRRVEVLCDEERKDFRRFSKALEDEMDACHGECLLKRAELAEIVTGALRFFDGSRYMLGDFVVMPNHVHLLVGGLARDAMLKQVESWKKWSAMKINEVLGRSGRFWQDESFDHLVRSEASFEKFRQYIAENPVKAGLRSGEFVAWRREE
ncbi:MAG: transposase [Verrucomicrobiaceae bacterium]|nr:transposase [Verrucomicrobiaceae bacterium]